MKCVISSLGAVTSVGLDVVTASAAIRAGISRTNSYPLMVIDNGDSSEMPLTGHPIIPFAGGFVGIGKWVRLAVKCIEDLREYGNLPGADSVGFWKNTAIILLTPYLHDDRYGWAEHADDDLLHEAYLLPLLDVLELPLSAGNSSVMPRASAGGAHAVEVALALIKSTKVERVIVMGADSFFDSESLLWLESEGRLKTGSNSTGMSPGEACGAFMLENELVASRRGARSEAFVEKVIVAEEKKDEKDVRNFSGEQLANSLQRVLNEETKTKFVGDIIVSLNGEPWLSAWWGRALPKLTKEFDLDAVRAITIAESLGDIGAAYMPIAICYAVRSFVRGYSLSNKSIIGGFTDQGEIGVVAIAK